MEDNYDVYNGHCKTNVIEPTKCNYDIGISTTSQHLQCYNVRNECKTISTLRCMTKPIDFLEQGEKCFHKTLTNICIKYNVFKSITCSTLCFEYHSININK